VVASYTNDRAFSDRYLYELRTIIGPYLLAPSSLEQDTKEAADLVVLRGRDMTVACRLRRPGYAEKYPRQFTMRSQRDNGTKTELAKVTEGWGDWFFYGHVAADLKSIAPWWLIDLSAWRAHLIRDGARTVKCLQHGDRANGDGTHFHWFKIDSFPSDPPLLIGESAPPVCRAASAPVTADDIPWALT
jgi:hypothetical protein